MLLLLKNMTQNLVCRSHIADDQTKYIFGHVKYPFQ